MVYGLFGSITMLRCALGNYGRDVMLLPHTAGSVLLFAGERLVGQRVPFGAVLSYIR